MDSCMEPLPSRTRMPSWVKVGAGVIFMTLRRLSWIGIVVSCPDRLSIKLQRSSLKERIGGILDDKREDTSRAEKGEPGAGRLQHRHGWRVTPRLRSLDRAPLQRSRHGGLHPPQYLREGDVGEGAEEGVGLELAAGEAGGGEAGQEAGEG